MGLRGLPIRLLMNRIKGKRPAWLVRLGSSARTMGSDSGPRDLGGRFFLPCLLLSSGGFAVCSKSEEQEFCIGASVFVVDSQMLG